MEQQITNLKLLNIIVQHEFRIQKLNYVYTIVA